LIVKLKVDELFSIVAYDLGKLHHFLAIHATIDAIVLVDLRWLSALSWFIAL